MQRDTYTSPTANSASTTLRINEAEAETVRTLYALYRKHGTLRQVKAEADHLGLRTKRRFAADGTLTGGLPFRRGHLHCLLTNPLYAGRIRHQRHVYEGQHPSIIAPELWDAVQTQLQAGAAKPRRRHDEGPRRPFPTGRQALRRDRRPADAEPHQKEKRATAPLQFVCVFGHDGLDLGTLEDSVGGRHEKLCLQQIDARLVADVAGVGQVCRLHDAHELGHLIGDFVGSEGSSVGTDQLAVGLALGEDFKRFQPHGIEGMRAEPVLC